ncbi:hypothetical protein [Actinacidiphila oryziradicis]|uniref:Uncharacterized protein n=1 Tax=Actinacidiphila oryziradicis TaxID=2571141 RepID=A0A4U0SPF1_9ACTN|nr:hypothetical protein [Actinacidiphila oryziradicis]TKA11792.1 hypothetical protein FCI23_10760 [Actinacidiphila oryziradicis]
MTSLPGNIELLRLYRSGRSDKEIAAEFGVTVQAVNWRLGQLGIQRHPHKQAATAIIEAVWPADKYRRNLYTSLSRGQRLFTFLRRRLDDPMLGPRQFRMAFGFEREVRERGVVLHLEPGAAEPWIWLPRDSGDDQMVIRWPEGRVKPTGKLLEPLDLPPEPWED